MITLDKAVQTHSTLDLFTYRAFQWLADHIDVIEVADKIIDVVQAW
jgi:hypothetical protein